jgi:hypothetical protein
MAKIVKDQLGKFIAIKEDGTRVPVDPSWVAESEAQSKPKPSLTPGQQVAQRAGLSPEGAPSPDGENPMIVRPEQGVSGGERFTLKNVANPEQVRQHLEDWGYEVRPYGDHLLKMQFAVRPKGTNGVWRPLDPDGFDWQDLTDLIGDLPGLATTTLAAIAAVPAATAAGLATGGPGALGVESAAVGLGSAAGEAIRQGTGVVTGVEPKMDMSQITAAGVVGAAVPVASKLLSPITRAIGRPLAYGFEKVGGGVRMAALRIMGAKGVEGMPLAEADAILRNMKGKTIVPIAEQAKAVQSAVKRVLTADWPEAAQANDMLAAARDAGAKIDFNPILEGIENAAGAVERRAAGAARPVVSEGEALAGRMRTGAPAVKPSFEEFQRTPVGQSARRLDIGRQATVAEAGSPGLADAEEAIRAGQKGKAFEKPPTPSELGRASPAATMPIGAPKPGVFNEGAGMASGAKRAAIAGHEAEFGAPGAFGAPGDISERLTGEAARAEFRDPGLRKELLSFVGRLSKRLSDQGFRLSEVPVDFANVVKQDLQALSRRGGAYAGKPIEEAFTRVMGDAASKLRTGIVDAMPVEIQKDFADVMAEFESKTKLAQAISNKVSDVGATEAWLREVYGNANSSGLRYIQQLEDRFGIKILPALREAQAKEIIGKGNITKFAEKHPYLAAAAIFHPETALPAVGGLAAAPAAGKGLQAVGRGIEKGTELAAAGARRLAASPEAKAAAVKILQDAAANSGKGITSENQASAVRKPRRVTRLF